MRYCGFQKRHVVLSPELVSEIYQQHMTKLFFPNLAMYMSSGPMLVMQLARERAVSYMNELAGPPNPARANITHPNRSPAVFHVGHFVSRLLCYFDNLSRTLLLSLPPPDRGAEYCDERVCLSACVFVCPRPYLWNCTSNLHPVHLTYGRGGFVIRYVLPVLWMTSCLLISQGCSTSPLS